MVCNGIAMIIIDKETGEALLPGGTRIGPQTSLARWFENPLAATCYYWVNDSIGSQKRSKGGGPQRLAYDQLTDPMGWYWVWFSTGAFIRDGYRLSVSPFYEGGVLHAIGIEARLEARASRNPPTAWPEYSAEDEHDHWDVLRRDLGEPNGRLTYFHRHGKAVAREAPGFTTSWGSATVARDPHMNVTSIGLQYAPRINKLIQQQEAYAEQERP